MKHLMPRVLQFPMLCRRVILAINGFNKRSPAESRSAAPEEVWYAIIGYLAAKGEFLPALNELVRLQSYMRPGECDQLLVGQLIPPVHKGPWAILLAPIEGMKPGKTGEYDESILLDSPGIEWMDELFQNLTANRDPSERLWAQSPETFQARFNHALTALGLDNSVWSDTAVGTQAPVPISCRNAGHTRR